MFLIDLGFLKDKFDILNMLKCKMSHISLKKITLWPKRIELNVGFISMSIIY